MSALVKKLLGRNIKNILVIMLAFGAYLLSAAFQFPVLIQLLVVSVVLLSLLQVREEYP